MKRQGGAALIVVLSVLVISMMLGLSGMQSSLVDERLAGNYKAAAQAQMRAEHAAAYWFESESKSIYTDFSSEDVGDDFGWKELLEFSGAHDEGGGACWSSGGMVACYVTVADGFYGKSAGEYIVSFGAVYAEGGSVIAQSGPVFVELKGEGETSPFQAPIIGCEGIAINGGSSIGSYRSDEGGWDGTLGAFAMGDTPLVRTLSGESEIVLGGDEHIYGSVASVGGLTMSGSSTVEGDVLANDELALNAGGGVVHGSVQTIGNVVFGSSARVDGAVKAGGNVSFDNWSAFVGEAIYAGGNIVSNTSRDDPSGHLSAENQEAYYLGDDGGVEQVPEQQCDSFLFGGNSLGQEMSRYANDVPLIGDYAEGLSSSNVNIGSWPNVDWEVSPDAMSRFDKSWNVSDWVEHAESHIDKSLGEASAVYRIGDLNLSQGGSLTVRGGDVVLIVDGDITMGGGGQGLVIEEDSSLTVFVSGKVDLGSVVNMDGSSSINQNGDPLFSVYSAYSGDDVGVNVDGGGSVVANVYAPFASVSVNSGADFYGTVRGKTVEVSGDGLIAYDELLSELELGENSGDSGEGGEGIISWR